MRHSLLILILSLCISSCDTPVREKNDDLDVSWIKKSISREMQMHMINHSSGSFFLYNQSGDSLVEAINNGYQRSYQLMQKEIENANDLTLKGYQMSFNTYLDKLKESTGCRDAIEVEELYEVLGKESRQNEEYNKAIIQLKILEAFDRKISCLFNDVSV